MNVHLDRRSRGSGAAARRRGLTAVVVGLSLVAALVVPATTATADHGSRADCTRADDPHGDPSYFCAPDGRWAVTLYNPYTRTTCRYDGTITWGDGTSETVTNWQDTQTVPHQYLSHGQFRAVIELRGSALEDGVTCDLRGSTSIVEVPAPAAAAEDEGRVASATFPLTHRVERAKKELKPRIDALIATRQQVDEDLALHRRGLRNRIRDHEARLDELEATQRLFSRLSAQVANGIGRADSEAMDHHRRIFREARVEELAARQLMQNAERDVRELLLARDDVDKRLLRLAEPYEALDFELLGLVVEAGSEPVYAVDLTSPYGRLLRLDREIRSLAESVEGLRAEKSEALQSFEGVHRAGSAQLAQIADLIWRNAKIKASVDLATSACDVAIAGAKGGWAGVAAEVAAKVFEAGIKTAVADPVGDPNPGAEAVEAWFRSTTTDAVGKSARPVGIERGIKETAGKAFKDRLGKALKARWPQLGPTNPPTGAAPAAVADAAQRSKGMLDRVKSISAKLKTERFGNGFKEWAKSSLGRKLIVDAGKAFLKRQLDNQEMAAWREYIKLDVQAQGLFSLWQAAANAYWETVDQLEAAQLEKDQILREFNPGTGQSVRLQEAFSVPQTLKVSLLVPRSAGPFQDVPVQVVVSGVRARRTGPKVFEVSTDSLPASALPRLTIEVR